MSFLRKFLSFTLVSLAVIFMGCDDGDSNPEPTTSQLLKLTIDASYNTKNVDNWVMVHDMNGALLGVKQYESGQMVNFETQEVVPDDKINVTLVSVDSSGVSFNSDIYFNLATYSQLSKGQEWKLTAQGSSTAGAAKAGSFTMDIGGIYYVPYSYAVSGDYIFDIGNFSLSGGTLHTKLDVYQQNTTVLVSMETELGHPKYRFLDNVVPGGNYQFSTADLKDFDHTLDVAFPATSSLFCILEGYDLSAPQSNYMLAFVAGLSPATRQSFRIGYLDRFQKYSLNLSLGYSNKTYSYYSNGAFPKAIDFPFDEDYGVQSTGVNDFSLKGSPKYSYLAGNFRLVKTGNPGIQVYWSIYSTGPGFKFTEFPSEITAVYSFLDVNAFQFSGASFMTKGQTYNEYIDHRFKGTGSDEYEQYTVGVSQ